MGSRCSACRTPGAPSLRGVLFVDTGSLAEDWSDGEIGKARVSVGFGVRVVVPFLGPRPVAVDFGFPLVSYDGDEEQLLSFSFGSNFYRPERRRRSFAALISFHHRRNLE